MKALLDQQKKLVPTTCEPPLLHKGEVRVSVRAIGVNHADLLQRAGKYPPPKGASEILGLEVAGVVEELGDQKTHLLRKGDRVMCLLSGGGYAEQVTALEEHCIPIPHNLSFEEAAAIPEAFLTAYQALFVIGELQPRSKVLIHAAASGVGTSAIQLARAVDALVIATTRSKEKLEPCLALGATAVINTHNGRFAQKVKETTEDHGVDLILDFVGAPYFDENMEAVARGGAIIFLSTLGGAIHKGCNLSLLIKKWATLSGSTLRNRPAEYKSKLIEEFSRFALSRFESGKLRPIIHTTLPWNQADEAHELLATGRAIGKIVLYPAV